jgi:hypothetical protein
MLPAITVPTSDAGTFARASAPRAALMPRSIGETPASAPL